MARFRFELLSPVLWYRYPTIREHSLPLSSSALMSRTHGSWIFQFRDYWLWPSLTAGDAFIPPNVRETACRQVPDSVQIAQCLAGWLSDVWFVVVILLMFCRSGSFSSAFLDIFVGFSRLASWAKELLCYIQQQVAQEMQGSYWLIVDVKIWSRTLKRGRVWVGEGNGTPLQYSCLENPMDRGAR